MAYSFSDTFSGAHSTVAATRTLFIVFGLKKFIHVAELNCN